MTPEVWRSMMPDYQSRWYPRTWRLRVTFQREEGRRVMVGVFGAHGSGTCWGHKWCVAAEIGERGVSVVNMVGSAIPKESNR